MLDFPPSGSVAVPSFATRGSTALLALKIDLAEKGQPNGVAPLNEFGKVDEEFLPDSILGEIDFQGTWDADANDPTIPAASAGNTGWFYIVAVAGTTTIDGISSWGVNDKIISNGTTWEKIPGFELVSEAEADAGLADPDSADASKTMSLKRTLYVINKSLISSANPRSFGAVFDGVTDDSVAFQAAADALGALNGGRVEWHGETYLPNVVLPSNVALKAQRGCGIINTGASGLIPVEGAGSRGAEILLTADASRGDMNLTVASTTGWAAGDVLNLSDAFEYASVASPNYRSGEYVRIDAVTDSTHVALESPVLGGWKRLPYTVAHSACVAKVTFAKAIGVEGVTFRGFPAEDLNSYMCRFQYVLDWRFEDNVIEGTARSGIIAEGGRGGSASGNRFENMFRPSAPTTGTYPIIAYGTEEDMLVQSNKGERMRHLFTTFGHLNGFPRRVNVLANSVRDNISAAYDTHNAGDEILFEGNIQKGGSKAGGGFGVRAQHVTIRDNEIEHAIDSTLTSIGIEGTESGLMGLTIGDNRITSSRQAINISEACDDLVITKNIIQAGLYGIDVGANADAPNARTVITDNIIQSISSYAPNYWGIRLAGAQGGTDALVAGNYISAGSGAPGSAIITAAPWAGLVQGNTAVGAFTDSDAVPVFSLLGTSMLGKGNTHNGMPKDAYAQAIGDLTGYITIADDTAVDLGNITLASGGKSCLLLVWLTHSAGIAALANLFRVRTNASPLAVNQLGPTANIVMSTSDVTGTTGSDGDFTVSATNGHLKFQNRTGGSIIIGYQKFGM